MIWKFRTIYKVALSSERQDQPITLFQKIYNYRYFGLFKFNEAEGDITWLINYATQKDKANAIGSYI